MRRSLLLCLAAAVACGKDADRSVADSATTAASPSPAAVPAALATGDLHRLRWIEGAWRGVGADGTDQAPFFETYRFLDDSTLLSLSGDSLMTKPDSSRFELRAGQLAQGDGSGPKWVATHLDDSTATFRSLTGPAAFTWRRVDADHWRASVGAGREYVMTRTR